MVIECSFGRLEGLFGALRRPIDIKLADLPKGIFCCFVFHNCYEMEKDPITCSRIQQAVSHDEQVQPLMDTNIEYQARNSIDEELRKIFAKFFE